MTNRVQTSPKAAPEYDVEYEDYSARYASPLKKGQAVLGYRSISPQKPQYPAYDTVDSAGSYESPIYRDFKHSGGRPDVRDGAEADTVKSKLHFSGGDSVERRDIATYQTKSQETPTPLSRYGKEYQPASNDSPYQSSMSAQYDPTQYQDKVCIDLLLLFLFSPKSMKIEEIYLSCLPFQNENLLYRTLVVQHFF